MAWAAATRKPKAVLREFLGEARCYSKPRISLEDAKGQQLSGELLNYPNELDAARIRILDRGVVLSSQPLETILTFDSIRTIPDTERDKAWPVPEGESLTDMWSKYLEEGRLKKDGGIAVPQIAADTILCIAREFGPSTPASKGHNRLTVSRIPTGHYYVEVKEEIGGNYACKRGFMLTPEGKLMRRGQALSALLDADQQPPSWLKKAAIYIAALGEVSGSYQPPAQMHRST
ncbi:MAG: hypothetical protein EBQ96_01410 [Proteobacteria bacterium]|nr:hypothetical protein [Pseudomonadota bacterium]